jgi:hypothetical protein
LKREIEDDLKQQQRCLSYDVLKTQGFSDQEDHRKGDRKAKL